MLAIACMVPWRVHYIGGTVSSICLGLVALGYSEANTTPIVNEGKVSGQLVLSSMILFSMFSVLAWEGLAAEAAGTIDMLLYEVMR